MGLSLPKSNLIFLKKCLDKWVHFIASNNLLFLQHGHPTCISFSIALPPSINAHNSMGFYESVSVLGLSLEDAVLLLLL